MPTMDDLGKLASQLYKGNPTINAYRYYSNLQWDQDAATALGFTSPNFYLWSGEERNSLSAYTRGFGSAYSGYGYGGRYDSNKQAVCLGD